MTAVVKLDERLTVDIPANPLADWHQARQLVITEEDIELYIEGPDGDWDYVGHTFIADMRRS